MVCEETMAGPRPASAVEDLSWRQELAGRPADEDSNGFFFPLRPLPLPHRTAFPSAILSRLRCCDIPSTSLSTRADRRARRERKPGRTRESGGSVARLIAEVHPSLGTGIRGLGVAYLSLSATGDHRFTRWYIDQLRAHLSLSRPE